jgi:uncharacterized membrane-anchored protein YhcB (DUF1043 family)
MSQGLPNSTDSDQSQTAPNTETQKPSEPSVKDLSNQTTAATGFAKILKPDERLIGGILISILPIIGTIIPFVPEKDRLTMIYVLLGSVVVVGFLVFLLMRMADENKKKYARLNNQLEIQNDDLQNSKIEMENQLKRTREKIRDTTREQRAFLFTLQTQTKKVIEKAKTSLNRNEISKDDILEIEQLASMASQQIQDALQILQSTQGSLSDAEDLDAVSPSFEDALMKLVENSKN